MTAKRKTSGRASWATRKCCFCKEEIDLSKPNGTFFVDGEKYTHCSCFIDHKMKLKKGAWDKDRCEEYVKQKLKTVEDDVLKKTIRVRLTDWLMNEYDVSYLPTFFYTKLDAVYSGTFKGQSRPVPPEHLFDMWQQKKPYLDKVAVRNATLGKKISGVDRLNYDLAILLNKYDSYLSWVVQSKENKKQVEESIQNMEGAEARPLFKASHSAPAGDYWSDIDKLLDEI